MSAAEPPQSANSAPSGGSEAAKPRACGDHTSIAAPRAAPVVTIAAAGARDIAVIQALAHDIWHRHYPGIISDAQIDYMLARSYNDEALHRYLTTIGSGLALALRDEDAVGFIGWYRLEARLAMKLDKLYVRPEHHGEGIGRLLIEHVVAKARAADCTAVTLNVNRNNVKAVRAYERCGFAIRERGDFPIGNGFVMEDFIMERVVS